MIERFHRTLNSMIAKTVDDNQRNWCHVIPGVMAAYRSTQHEATGYSPNFLMFGRENRMPVDIVFGTPNQDDPSDLSTDDFVAELQQTLRRSYDLARDHLGKAALRRKEQYDATVKSSDIQVGTWVWCLYPRRRTGLYAKWQRWYTGPVTW
jgi:hypothetical protein